MNSSLKIFKESLNDISALLDLSHSDIGLDSRYVIFRSAIVLLVASWEQFIEQLAKKSVIILTSRLRNSDPVPEGVKQSIALYAVSENRSNRREFSNSVWQFSDKGWKQVYADYCETTTSKLNTASSENVKELYKNILGLRDITSFWVIDELSSEGCVSLLNNIVDHRHDIAHGANRRAAELREDLIRSHVEFISKIARITYSTIFDHTATLSSAQALTYSLSKPYYAEIITLGSQKVDRMLRIEEIRALSPSAYGNHNKLCYQPWALLEEVNRNVRRVTDQLIQFHNGELELPVEILVFDNGEAIPAPNTRNVRFVDINI